MASKRASAGAEIYDKTPSSYQHEWDEEGTTQIQAEVAGNESSSERSGFDDDNDLMVEDYSGCFGTKSENLAKGIDYGMGVENGNDELDDD